MTRFAKAALAAMTILTALLAVALIAAAGANASNMDPGGSGNPSAYCSFDWQVINVVGHLYLCWPVLGGWLALPY